MANFPQDDTLFSRYRLNRKRITRFLLLGFLIFLSTTLLFTREQAALEEKDEFHHVAAIQKHFTRTITATATITATTIATTTATTATTATVTTTITPPPHIETVVFSLIMWSHNSAIEGALLIKSILMYTSSPTEFHIICDQAAHDYLQARLNLLTHLVYPVTVRFYQTSMQDMKERLAREGSLRSDHPSGIPGLMKLFIHEILPPTVTKAIYIDTDAFLISDITLLWNVFSKLKPTTAVTLPMHPDQHSPIWNHASRICSCVMLLDLQKLRQLRFMDSSVYRRAKDGPPALAPPTFRAMYGEPGPNGYQNVKLGDQGYLWAIVSARPDLFEPLSFDFEITSCLMDTYSIGLGDDGRHEEDDIKRQSHIHGTPQEGTLIRPKLLHFNCLAGDVYMNWEGWSNPEQALTKRWGHALFYHHGYRWIWLNRGTEPRKVDISTNTNVVFADIQAAQNHDMEIS